MPMMPSEDACPQPIEKSEAVETNSGSDMSTTIENLKSCPSSCWSRRHFLESTGAITVTTLLGRVFPDRVYGQDPRKTVTSTQFPNQTIGILSKLSVDQPLTFSYPNDGPHQRCTLVRTGELSGGGIGPHQDIVAFSTVCTHMGGDLEGLYQPNHKVLGPCGEHLTTFDLTRHGIVVAGHATQALPQVILELDGDKIVARGIVGLLYGFHQQPSKPAQ